MAEARVTSKGGTDTTTTGSAVTTTTVRSTLALISAVGLFFLAGFWLAGGFAIGSAQWLFADLPDADADLLRPAVPLLVGAGFALCGAVQVTLSRVMTERPGTAPALLVTCVGLAAAMSISAIAVGAWVSTAVETTVTNVLPSAGSLNSSGWDPARMTIAAVLLGVLVLLAPWVRPPRRNQQSR